MTSRCSSAGLTDPELNPKNKIRIPEGLPKYLVINWPASFNCRWNLSRMQAKSDLCQVDVRWAWMAGPVC